MWWDGLNICVVDSKGRLGSVSIQRGAHAWIYLLYRSVAGCQNVFGTLQAPCSPTYMRVREEIHIIEYS
jgi:hypothetical protein